MNAGLWRTISVPTLDGDIVELATFPTTTPGLAVSHPDAGPWRLIHTRSGCAVCYASDPEHAQRLAVALAPVVDWTMSADAIRVAVTSHDLDDVIRPLGGSWPTRVAVDMERIDRNTP